MVIKWNTLTVELLDELYQAREALSSHFYRDDGTSVPSWEAYCREIGLVKRTVNRWLSLYDPDTGTLTAPVLSLITYAHPKEQHSPETRPRAHATPQGATEPPGGSCRETFEGEKTQPCPATCEHPFRRQNRNPPSAWRTPPALHAAHGGDLSADRPVSAVNPLSTRRTGATRPRDRYPEVGRPLSTRTGRHLPPRPGREGGQPEPPRAAPLVTALRSVALA